MIASFVARWLEGEAQTERGGRYRFVDRSRAPLEVPTTPGLGSILARAARLAETIRMSGRWRRSSGRGAARRYGGGALSQAAAPIELPQAEKRGTAPTARRPMSRNCCASAKSWARSPICGISAAQRRRRVSRQDGGALSVEAKTDARKERLAGAYNTRASTAMP